MESINLQLSAFFFLLIAGIFMGVIFDLYRVLRSRIFMKNRGLKLIDIIGDLLFWVFAFITITPLIYWGTWLELRLYVWLFMVLGLLFYFGVFSKVLIPQYLRFWKTITWLPKMIIMVFIKLRFAIKKSRWQFDSKKTIKR